MKFPIGIKILGVGAGIPSTIISNADLEKLVATSDEWIASRTGISERRIVLRKQPQAWLVKQREMLWVLPVLKVSK